MLLLLLPLLLLMVFGWKTIVIIVIVIVVVIVAVFSSSTFPFSRTRGKIESQSANRADRLILHGLPQTLHVKHVVAWQFLRLLHAIAADRADVIRSCEFFLRGVGVSVRDIMPDPSRTSKSDHAMEQT